MKPSSQEQQDRQAQKLIELLKPLGFEPQNRGHFYHPLLNMLSDFSAACPEGIPSLIFEAGRKQGIRETQLRIQQALGVEK
jgi:hypothetical protein